MYQIQGLTGADHAEFFGPEWYDEVEVYEMKHEYGFYRVVKLGSAIGSNREWRYTRDPAEALRLARAGWTWAEGGCDGPVYCDVCEALIAACADEC